MKIAELKTMAVRYLHRREHSAAELAVKLQQKGADATSAQEVILYCQEQGWQSDKRFTSMWLRNAYAKGHGLYKAQQQLQTLHQIEAHLIDQVAAELDLDWLALAQQVMQKKFKQISLSDPTLQRKVYQFLYQRGFNAETIHQAFHISDHMSCEP